MLEPLPTMCKVLGLTTSTVYTGDVHIGTYWGNVEEGFRHIHIHVETSLKVNE